MKHVRLTHLDGNLPNLALMRLAAWHRSQGDIVHFSQSPERLLGEPDYDVVYGSAIFNDTAPAVTELRRWWPDAVLGGTGSSTESTVAQFVPEDFSGIDYSIYPKFKASLGFTQRGCRFRCTFCCVPGKEGRPNSFSPIHSIWRGPGHPKKLHLLDNDFFGGAWEDRVEEIRDRNFRVCINQGINLRILSEKQAMALASIEYRNDAFTRRMIYTAWDNPRDERVFFRGVDRLNEQGVPPSHLMAYNLVGFFPDETWEAIWHRHDKQVAAGIMPYIMIHNAAKEREPNGPVPDWSSLKRLQRWVNLGLYRTVPFADYRPSYKTERHRVDPRQTSLF